MFFYIFPSVSKKKKIFTNSFFVSKKKLCLLCCLYMQFDALSIIPDVSADRHGRKTQSTWSNKTKSRPRHWYLCPKPTTPTDKKQETERKHYKPSKRKKKKNKHHLKQELLQKCWHRLLLHLAVLLLTLLRPRAALGILFFKGKWRTFGLVCASVLGRQIRDRHLRRIFQPYPGDKFNCKR